MVILSLLMTSALSGVTGYKPVRIYVDLISSRDSSIASNSKKSSFKGTPLASPLALRSQPIFGQTQHAPAAEGLTAHRGASGRIQNEIHPAKLVATSHGDQGAPSAHSDKTMSFSAPIHRQVVHTLRSADDFDGVPQGDRSEAMSVQREPVASEDSTNKASKQEQSAGVAEHVTRFSPAHHDSSAAFSEPRTSEKNVKYDPALMMEPSSAPLSLPDVLSVKDDMPSDGATPVVHASVPFATPAPIDADAVIEALDMEPEGIEEEAIALTHSEHLSIPVAPSLPAVTVSVAPSIPTPLVRKIHVTKPPLGFLEELRARYGRQAVPDLPEIADDMVHVEVHNEAVTSEGGQQHTASISLAPSLPAVTAPVAPSISASLVKKTTAASDTLNFMDELRARWASSKHASPKDGALQASMQAVKGLNSLSNPKKNEETRVDPGVFGAMSGILQSIKRGVALKQIARQEPKPFARANQGPLIDMLHQTKSRLSPSPMKRVLIEENKTNSDHKAVPTDSVAGLSAIVDLSRACDNVPVFSLKPFAKRATPVQRELDIATAAPMVSEKQELAQNKVEESLHLPQSEVKADVPRVDKTAPIPDVTPTPVKRSSSEILAKVAFRQHSGGSLADILARGGHLGLRAVQPQPEKESFKDQPPVVQALSHSSGSFAARIFSVSRDLDDAIDLDDDSEWTDDENQTFEPENTSCNLYLSGQERTTLYFEQLTKESELKTSNEGGDQESSILKEKGSSQNHLLDALSIRRKAILGENEDENDMTPPDGYSTTSDDEEDFDF